MALVLLGSLSLLSFHETASSFGIHCPRHRLAPKILGPDGVPLHRLSLTQMLLPVALDLQIIL